MSPHNKGTQDNILISRKGGAILSDFGLSRQVSSALFSNATQVLGNPAWMAPELLVVNAEIKYTKMSDIWACGMTLMVSFLDHAAEGRNQC
jgi:serine/threonine protein kinase